MNQYIAFGGDKYYPVGGFGDFVGDYETLKEAKAADTFSFVAPNGKPWQHYEWFHILNVETGEIVYNRKIRDGY